MRPVTTRSRKELGTAGKAVQNLSNKVPGLKLVIPFVRTPANIVKFAGERSMFGLAMPEVRDRAEVPEVVRATKRIGQDHAWVGTVHCCGPGGDERAI